MTRECALHGCEALNSDIGSREKGVYFDVTAFFTPHSSVHKAATGEVRGFGSGSVFSYLCRSLIFCKRGSSVRLVRRSCGRAVKVISLRLYARC